MDSIADFLTLFISSIYDKLKKLLKGSNTRINEITNLRLVSGVSFLKKSDLKSSCIKIDWNVEGTTRTILVRPLDKVRFLGTRSVSIKQKNRRSSKNNIILCYTKRKPGNSVRVPGSYFFYK